jgi:hypothetical protein
MTADTIARLKVTLDHVKPTVLRRVEVPFDIRLDRLHLTLQAAIGWTKAISTRYAHAMSDGARPIPTPIEVTTSSTRARHALATYWKTWAPRR